MKKLAFLSAVLLFASCATSISTKLVNKNYQKLNDDNQIIVLEKNEELPSGSELIGDLKIGDSGFTTDCGYNKVIADATAAAKNSGANIIKVIELKEPSVFGSTCYRLKAKIYRNLDAESLSKITANRKEKKDPDFLKIVIMRYCIFTDLV